MNRVALFLARRMQWRSEGRRQTSPSVAIAVSGVALAVMVMSISIAVVLGFKHEVKSTIMGIDDAITIRAYTSDGETRPLNVTETLEILCPQADGAEVISRIESAAILKTDNDFMAIRLEGNPTAVQTDSINSIAMSAMTATRLGLTTGEKIPAYFFINNRLRARQLRVDSIYSTGVEEHDASVAYCSTALLRNLLNLNPDEASSLGLRGINQEEIVPLADRIHSSLLSAYYSGRTNTVYGITTILQSDAVYFTWLDLLDTNVVVILTLMAAVAAFTLISSLFIIILERVKTIGLLKSLGASDRLVRHTFMLMAERLVLKGLVIGDAVAISLILLQRHTHMIPLDSANYYVDHVPAAFSMPSMLLLNAGVILLSWVVLILPALIIARISPASTMRYE